jgi:hypothetical protein
MTNATVKPIADPQDAGERRGEDFAELLSVLADLAVRVRSQRERVAALASGGDERVRAAAEHLAELENHAREVHAEAAAVHNELQVARLV